MQYDANYVETYIKNSLLSKTGEAFFDFSLENEMIYSDLNMIGNGLCIEIIGDDSFFYILESTQVQAVAIHGYRTVLVYRGMLEFIFRISAMMVGSQSRLNDKDKIFYEPWRDNINAWLNGGVFDWEDERYWWIHDETSRDAFYHLVEWLFEFVVLHEIGHIHNLHGERRNDNEKAKVFIHRAVSFDEEKDESERLSAHAREIIADTYAFQFLFEDCKEHMFSKSIYPDVDEGGLLVVNYIYCIYIVASFFWAMSIIRPMKNNEQNDCYPSHAFRLTAIETASLEHNICGSDRTKDVLMMGMNNYIKHSMSASGDDRIFHWRNTMNYPANQDHYERICNITKEWANLKFGVRDEDWLPPYLRD